ncbi:SOS response-associated peptidase [Halococcoides cellulosivorans]|uniref:SOS response-associated peptidase n=1 Tax=Halococcoides cellulosivorans TaxID=1679096 RepID=A0A2R4X3W6_9EURY|nr:SOS response-associated peptidase [Halococcoides cellulosivorans]AWB28491.1 SOS response-associated peptidase [Halococcoides cellulosivorans]
MCGRNSLFVDQADLEATFDATLVADGGYKPRYNIAPGDDLEVITTEAPDEIDRFHWGLVPPWADDPSDGIINARSETVDEKRVFQDAWASRPCLVLSSGFYEWQAANGGPKQPYRIYREDAPAFAMAGIYDEWTGDGETLSCVTILTTEPNDLMKPIHDRMPVVLPQGSTERWLSAGPDERLDLCQPYPEDDLDAYPISRRVNDPSNDSPQVIEPEDHEQSGLGDFDGR